MPNDFDRAGEPPRDRELSTADLAAAAERQSEEHEYPARGPMNEADRGPMHDRELARNRNAGLADAPPAAAGAPSLLAPDIVEEFRARWSDIQAGFVDEPRRAVEQADSLVADAIKRLAESFARERANLEGQWDRGGDVSTEDLRQALQRYRSFFTRLLSV